MWVRFWRLRSGPKGISQTKKEKKKASAREQMFAKSIFDKELILGFDLSQTTLT